MTAAEAGRKHAACGTRVHLRDERLICWDCGEPAPPTADFLRPLADQLRPALTQTPAREAS